MIEQQLPRWLTCHPSTFYTEGTFLVLDYETDNEQYGSALVDSNDIVLACWSICDKDGNILQRKHKFGGIYELQELLDDIASVDFIVAQGMKFELQWTKRCGADLHDFHGYDTLLAAWVMDGNRRTPRNLDALSRRYGSKGKSDLVAKLIKCGVNPRDIKPSWLLEYCFQDVDETLFVFLQQRKELTARGQWHLAHVRNLCCSVLADLEFEGLCLDPERVAEEYTKASSIKEDIGKQLAEMTGGINLNSPKQLKEYLYNKLKIKRVKDYKKQEQDSANAKILAKLKPETEEQKKFLRLYKDYNKQNSLLEKNLEYFKLTCEQKAGKFQVEIKQNVVQTHRLASSGIPILFKGYKKPKSVQGQNLPREYKRLFCSGEEDWLVAEYDGSGMEFRVAVDMANDQMGWHEIENGVDIHSFTAQVLEENGDEEICALSNKKEKRQESKKSTFKPLYGGSSGSEAIKAYCEFFKDKYKDIAEMQRVWCLQCVDKGQFTTPFGMTFYFPGTKVQRSGYITNSTLISNYPVQSGATAEIIPIALVHYWHRARGKNIKLFLTIHDSIVCKVHKDAVEESFEIAKQSMTHDVYRFLKDVYGYSFQVPLGLGAKVSTHWGDTDDEIKLDVFPDGREVKR